MKFLHNASYSAALSARIIRANPNRELTLKEKFYAFRNNLLRGDVNDFGVVCRKLVTTAGVTEIANALVGTNDADPKTTWCHLWGTGTTAESVAQTTLVTSALPTNSADGANSVTGTRVSGISGANATCTSVATITAAGALNITEHAIYLMNAAKDSGENMLDRSVFTAIPVGNGDSIQFTYVLTLNSGG